MSDDVSMVEIDGKMMPRRTQPVLNDLRTLLRDWSQHTDTSLVSLIQDLLAHHGWWSDEDHDAAAERRARFNREVAEGDRAYDGWSAEPQKRELTPRERDILCRILRDVVNPRARIEYPPADGEQPMLSGLLDRYDARVTIDNAEVEQLRTMRFVLDPRHD